MTAGADTSEDVVEPATPEAEALPDLADIKAAEGRIRSRIVETPALYAHDLSDYLDQPLWLKAENLQRTGSFKARGASHWIATATAAELARGLVTVSAGNHAIALAWAARQMDTSLTVVMPEGSSPIKIATTRDLGAEVRIHGTISEAVALCHQLVADEGRQLVHPYNDVRVMAGQGTVGLELLRQVPTFARVLCPVGGGGLISGMGIALKACRPDLVLIGVEPEGAATLANAWACGRADAALSGVSTIAASLAPVVVGSHTYSASRLVVDQLVQVPDTAIAEATRLLLARTRLYCETGAAVGLAALLTGAVPAERHAATVLVLTGGNMDLAQAASL